MQSLKNPVLRDRRGNGRPDGGFAPGVFGELLRLHFAGVAVAREAQSGSIRPREVWLSTARHENC